MTDKFAIQGVDAATPLFEAAPAILLAKATPLFDLEEAVSGGTDADAVHDMRVASRRLREAMRIFRPLYPGRDYRTWYRYARRVTRALGPVRDADVFVDELGRLAAGMGEGGARCLAFMIGYRLGQREHELDALNRELARLDLSGGREAFEKTVRRIGSDAGAGGALAGFAQQAMRSRVEVLIQAQPAALAEGAVLAQHALRIDYKRLRYALEAFRPCFGEDFSRLHRTLTAFQDTLGELHDTHVFLEMLADPERARAATRAGVSPSDAAEVVATLEARAHERYNAFVALAEQHPVADVAAELLRG